MTRKLLLLLLLLVSFTVLVATTVDARHETVNESFLLTTIPVCDGPVTIRVNSDKPVTMDELFIEKCRQDDYNMWRCDCDKKNGEFDINVRIFEKTDNVYDFWVHHYIYYDESWVNDSSRVPTFNELRLSKFERFNRYNNIYVKEPTIESKTFELSKEVQNIILIVVLIVIIIILIFVYRTGGLRGKTSTDSKKNDMMNYASNDDDFEELIKRMK